MEPIKTDRLILRHLETSDAVPILELLNEPPFIQYIADKGVRTILDAEKYLLDGPMLSYHVHGYGLYAVQRSDANDFIGICGLIQRPQFVEPDLGFAFFERHWHQGFAIEAAHATLKYGFNILQKKRIIAITDPNNTPSRRVLENVGMSYEGQIFLPDYGGNNLLYSIESNLN